MLHIFSTAANAVLPILLLILLGYLLRNFGFLTDAFLNIASKLVFRIGLTCLLFVNAYNITDLSSVSWSLIVYIIGVTFVLFVLGYVSAVLTTKVPERRGVILQYAFRSNFAYIGLPLAAALAGDEAVTLASLIAAFILPIYNILGVIALSMFVGDKNPGKTNVKQFFLSIVRNPIVLGAAMGLLCVLLRQIQNLMFDKTVFSIKRDLPFLYEAVNSIKIMTTPLALIVLGGQFRFNAVKGMFKEIVVGTLWRIVIAPIIGVGGALIAAHLGLFTCGAGEIATLIALFGAPGAVAGAVMAGEMGNDEQLATQHVIWTSIGSVVTIFLQVCILMAAGILNL